MNKYFKILLLLLPFYFGIQIGYCQKSDKPIYKIKILNIDSLTLDYYYLIEVKIFGIKGERFILSLKDDLCKNTFFKTIEIGEKYNIDLYETSGFIRTIEGKDSIYQTTTGRWGGLVSNEGKTIWNVAKHISPYISMDICGIRLKD